MFRAGDRVRLTAAVATRTDRHVPRTYRPVDRFTVREWGSGGRVWCEDWRGNRVPLPADLLAAVDVREEQGAT
jgi:hypothetical protein